MKNKIMNSKFYKRKIEKLDPKAVFIGGSRANGIINENSDYDIVVFNDTVDIQLKHKIEGIWIDFFFKTDLYKTNFGNFVNCYNLYFNNESDELFLKKYNFNKEQLLETIKLFIRSKKEYLENPKPQCKRNYHFCIVAQLLKKEPLNKCEIGIVKEKRVITDFMLEQFEYLKGV